jgi:NADH-quinone oxidoreductase subunit G
MTEHVCPVGALTSSDFRFKARVWFLRSARTVCQGCATGCNAYLDFDPRTNTPHRHRPRENMEVNKYWMCDEGMLSYRRAVEGRLLGALVGGDDASVEDALSAAKEQLKGHGNDPSRVAIVLSAQHSNEDNFAMVTLAKTYLGAGDFYVSGRALGRGDDILMSEDKNPNTRGVMQVASTTGPRPIAELLTAIDAGAYKFVIALGSELEVDAAAAKETFSKLKGLVTIAAHDGPLSKAAHVALPACSWAEAEGTYVNRNGLAQKSERALTPRGDARPGWELVARLARALGYAMDWKKLADVHRAMAPEVFGHTAADRVGSADPGGADKTEPKTEIRA